MNAPAASRPPPYVKVLFTPADFAALRAEELADATCVVFDVLRATSTIVTALANGAQAVIPVADIAEALSVRAEWPEVLLAGERNGLRIRAGATGGIEFDLGNSPREFVPEKVRGRTIVMTTTNGTRALRACAGARAVLLSCFLNLGATARFLAQHCPDRLLLVCSGTGADAAWEDALAAGALCGQLQGVFAEPALADSAHFAHEIYRAERRDLAASLRFSRNAQRLLAIPELRGDVEFCLREDTLELVAGQAPGGEIRRLR